MNIKKLSFFLLLAVSPGVFAQQLLIKADAMVDVESGRLQKNIAIIIDNEKITAVVSQNELADYKASKVIDLSGYTLLPGLFDMHVHLTANASVHGYKGLERNISRSAIDGVLNAERTINAGFTSVRNLGAEGYADIALRDAINDGDIPGPRIFASGPSLSITGGHCDNNLLSHEYDVQAEGVADGPWALVAKARKNIKYGADVLKVCVTGGVLSKGTKVGAQQFSDEEIKAVVDEGHRRGLTVAAHAHGVDGIKAAIIAGVDSVEHASFLDKEAIKLAKKHGTYLSMDIYTTEYILEEGEAAGILAESLAKERTVGGIQRESFARAVKAGVKMVFGSDAGVYPHGNNAKQFARMKTFGMSELQALQAATINAATLLNKQKSLGSIKVGKFADIIAVKSNPLKNLTVMEDVVWVMKSGRVLKSSP